MAACIADVLKRCHTCQVVGKPSQAPSVDPLPPSPPSTLDDVMITPDWSKKAQLCHPRPYFTRDGQDGPFSFAEEEASLVLFLGCKGEASDTLVPEPVVPMEQWDHEMLRGKLDLWDQTRGEELVGPASPISFSV